MTAINKATQACTCIALVVTTVVISSSVAAQSATTTHQQQAVCTLKLQGTARLQSIDSMVTSAELDCNSTSPVIVAINSTYLRKHVSRFTGVRVVTDSACKQQARGGGIFTNGTRVPFLAMLFFCGDYHLTLLQPRVQNITLAHNSSDRNSAVLAFGGNARVIISQGRFSGNSADSTIVAVHKAALTVQDNTAIEHNTGSFGAGIMALDEADVVIKDAELSYNQALDVGGAVSCCHNATVTVDGAVFRTNSARKGGALEISCRSRRQVTLSNTSFHANSAEVGGGVFCAESVTVNMTNSSYTDNKASTAGAGIYLSAQSAIAANECTFSGNNASYGGGLFCQSCTVQADRMTFSYNIGVSHGGAVYLKQQANATIVNSSMVHNTAGVGGAIACEPSSRVTLRGSRLASNSAYKNGAGAYCSSCEIDILQTVVEAATTAVTGGADISLGGGLYGAGSAKVVIAGSNFTSCVAANGAAVYLTQSAKMRVSSSSFWNNSATKFGGAVIALDQSRSFVNSSSFEGNRAQMGGALAAGGSAQVVIRGSIFTNSSADQGAAIFSSDSSNMRVSSSSFWNNSAISYGGAVIASGQSRSFVNSSSFEGNRAAKQGGALAAGGSAQVVIRGSRFINSNADQGAAVFLSESSNMRVSRSSFWNNSAISYGGAVVISGQSRSFVNSSSFEGNRAAKQGGALAISDSAQVVIDRSNFTNGSADQGAAMYVEGGNVHVSSSSFWTNLALVGGGAVVAGGQGRIFLNSSSFEGNRAQSGGALSLGNNAQVFVRDNCSLTGNSASFGGAVYLEADTKISISNSTISGNNATSGGGIAVGASTSITITDGTLIQGNHADDTGGGMIADGSAQVFMEQSHLSDNKAVTSGGGLMFEGNAHGNLTGCIITSNAAGGTGGGVHSIGDTALALVDSLVSNNTAGSKGGGIAIEGTAHLMLRGNTSVTSNHAHLSGGGTYLFSGDFDIHEVTAAVHHNTALYNANVQPKLTNLTIIGNSSIFGYANRVGSDEGVLLVVVNTSGYYGLPCQGLQAQALLDDTFLSVDRSDQQGLAHMSFKVARPPGVYVVSFLSPDGADVPPANLTVHVRNCARGEVTPSPDACQPCQQGFFSFDPSQGVCDACPVNANCSGGDNITPLSGYWKSSAESATVHRCPNPRACQSANEAALLACASDTECGTSATYKDLQCTLGYYGNLCGLCSVGRAAVQQFVCRDCMKAACIIALYSSAAVVMLCLIKLLCHLSRNQEAAHNLDDKSKVPAAQLLKPLILYSQYILIISSMPVEWPATMSYPLKALAWVWSPTAPDTLSIDCLLQRDAHVPTSIQKVLFYACTPIIILIFLLLVEMAQSYIICARRPGAAEHMRDKLYNSALVSAFFFYPSVLRIVFSIFACVPIDQPAAPPYLPTAVGSYWVLDMNHQCFTGYHKAWALAFGLPCILLLCVGGPLGVLFLMLRKKSVLAEQATRQHYGFLYMSYRQPLFFWECIVMAQTTVLVAVSVFGVNLGVFYQVIAMEGALMLMVISLLIFKPYAYHQAGKVTLQAMFCLLLTSYTSLTFLHFGSIQPSPVHGVVMGSVVLVVNVVFIVSVLWQLLKLTNWKLIKDIMQKVYSKVRCGQCSGNMLVGVDRRQPESSV